MSVSEMANQAMEVQLGDKKLLVSRMSIAELYGPAESKVIGDYKANMISISQSLTGRDKMDYLREATKDIPKGAILLAAAQEYLGTPEGYFDLVSRALNKHQKINEDEILKLLSSSSEEEKTLLIAHLMGTDYDTAKSAMSTADEEGTKKK